MAAWRGCNWQKCIGCCILPWDQYHIGHEYLSTQKVLLQLCFRVLSWLNFKLNWLYFIKCYFTSRRPIFYHSTSNNSPLNIIPCNTVTQGLPFLLIRVSNISRPLSFHRVFEKALIKTLNTTGNHLSNIHCSGTQHLGSLEIQAFPQQNWETYWKCRIR